MHREPLYIQVKNRIQEMISAGQLQYGQSLPPERELAERFGVNRKTLRKATQILESEGILTRLQGKGTYLSKQSLYEPNRISGFTEMVQAQGMTHSSRLLYAEALTAGPGICGALSLPPNAPVYRIVRLRLGDGRPMALQSSFFPLGLVPNVEKVDFNMFSLYDVFVQHGITVKRVQERITPLELNDPEAKLLGCPEGSPGFAVEDVTYDDGGRAIEYTKTYLYNQIISMEALPREDAPG